MEPMLLRLRSGRIAAAALVLGFGGGTMLIGLGTLVAGRSSGLPIAGTLLGYALVALPFVLAGAVVAPCKSELWLVPEARALQLLTFRPWRRGPRVEQASLDEYAGVSADRAGDRDGGGAIVSLVTRSGERVEVRQFRDEGEAVAFAARLAARAGLWSRGDLIDAPGAVDGDAPPSERGGGDEPPPAA
ncbi:MAG TPA: hypothetical protein VHB21_26605 [Minicystis sp.]|nr:hypothetical protein [Minicystis sp.]